MITLAIRYTLDANKLADFETYAKAITPAARQCGASAVSYYLPTKFAGVTNMALALLDFPSLAADEQYRERLAKDEAASAALTRAEKAGCVLVEDRSFIRRAAEAR